MLLCFEAGGGIRVAHYVLDFRRVRFRSNFAASGPGTGTANGDYALAMAELQTKKILGNNAMSLNESFSQIVNKVGVLTQQNATAAKAQATLIQQNYAAQQTV